MLYSNTFTISQVKTDEVTITSRLQGESYELTSCTYQKGVAIGQKKSEDNFNVVNCHKDVLS